MPKIIAIGSPKGGVGKSVIAIHMATIAARDYGKDVLLVDTDTNETALRWADRGTAEAMPFTVSRATGSQAEHLAHLRRGRRHDLIVVDLAGGKAGGFETMLRGLEDRPVADLLVMPSHRKKQSIEPCVDVLRDEVIPLGVPHLLVFNEVHTKSLHIGQQRQLQMRKLGFTVANTIVRQNAVYEDAYDRDCTVLDLPGSYARIAETEQRALAYDALNMVGLAA